MRQSARLYANVSTYGEPHNVSAMRLGDSGRAKPKSATFRMGTPIGCPFARSDSEAGFRRRFYIAMSTVEAVLER